MYIPKFQNIVNTTRKHVTNFRNCFHKSIFIRNMFIFIEPCPYHITVSLHFPLFLLFITPLLPFYAISNVMPYLSSQSSTYSLLSASFPTYAIVIRSYVCYTFMVVDNSFHEKSSEDLYIRFEDYPDVICCF